MSSRLERLLKDVEPGNGGFPGSGRHEARQNPHGCAFACSIRAEEAHDFAFANLEVEIVNGGLPGITFGEVFYLNHEIMMRQKLTMGCTRMNMNAKESSNTVSGTSQFRPSAHGAGVSP